MSNWKRIVIQTRFERMKILELKLAESSVIVSSMMLGLELCLKKHPNREDVPAL